MLNTFVAGTPGSVRASAEAIRQTGTGVEDIAEGWHRARSRSESAWEGHAADGFRDQAGRTGKDADGLADLFGRLAQALTVFADDLDTVRARMEQARQAAREGELTVLPNAITPPTPLAGAPSPLPNGASAADSAAHSQATVSFQAAQALHGKQQAAYDEAQATVNGARQIEQTAHTKLTDALNAASNGLGGLGQSAAWAQAATSPTNPAAAALAGAAANLENHSAAATQAMFTNALAGGPFATNAAWSAMSAAQQHELIDRCPQLVGSADGLPAAARSAANKRTLATQRQTLVSKLRDAEERLRRSEGQPNGPNVLAEREVDDLHDAIRGLDAISGQANQPDMYLLSLDADANGRGQVALAHGNPDTAQNVMTTVPGTYSDLGDAMDYVHNGDTVMHRAQQLAPGQSFSSVTWVNYEAPKSLLLAGNGGFANDAGANLSNFQEGLRASHDPHQPSNNSVIGHSYGSTVVGYAARDHGLPVNNIGFIGSPGVGVDNASALHMPPGHVWSGTAGLDVIQYATPSPNPVDYFPLDKPDHLWFGVNPSDHQFGARQIPTDGFAGHSGYWSHDQSVDGMARIVANQSGGPAAP